ncbi:hypothetical protein L204_105632 [Cryptococcus depauperatus]
MEEPPQKRFRYASYNEQIRNISVDVGKQRGLGWEKEEYNEETEQTKTPLTTAIGRLSLLDLTVPYQNFQETLLPVTNTLPVTLHNLPQIQGIFHEFYINLDNGQDHIHSGLGSVLELHQALYETCLGEAVSYIPQTVQDILRVAALRALGPRLVEESYSTLSLILRTIASSLLKPSADSFLRETWAHIKTYLSLGANKDYVRRCSADAWVGVIRKARSDGLVRLMSLLLKENVDGMEAVWAHSMKGSSGQLHSRALAIYKTLFDHLIDDPTTQHIRTLVLVSTALVHHTSSLAIQPIVEIVISRLDHVAPLHSSTAILHVIAVFLFVRKGKQFPEALLKPVMQKFQTLTSLLVSDACLTNEVLSESETASREEWRKALVTCVVGSLQAGQLQHWLSPGVGLIEDLWGKINIQEASAFVNVLISIKWAGIEQFILSHVAKTSCSSLITDPLSTLALLNSLVVANYLAGGLLNVQGGRWRQSLVSALVKQLEFIVESNLEYDERMVLGQILRLLPALHKEAAVFMPLVIELLEAVFKRLYGESEDALKEEWRLGGAWNDTHVLGSLIRAANQLISNSNTEVGKGVKELFVRDGWLRIVLENWSWNSEILRAAVPHVERWAIDLDISHDILLERYTPNLLSNDSTLRLASLQILVAIAPSSALASSAGENSPTFRDIYNHCVQIESSEMTLRNVRERTTNITRLTRTLIALPMDPPANVLKAVVTYLVAQLKVNFRPIYPEAIAALSSISEKHKKHVWETVWSELQRTNSAQATIMTDLDVENPIWVEGKLKKDARADKNREGEEEIEFRCSNLEKSRSTFSKVWGKKYQEDKLVQQEIDTQISKDRLDVLNYESQLLSTLTAIPSVTEKHTRLIVPVFLYVARQGALGEDGSQHGTHLSTKQLQDRTANYLQLFTKFVNPKAAFLSEKLHQLYLDILSKGEQKLQAIALKCLMTYKSVKLLPYEESLENLLADDKFRDELARMKLGLDSQDYILATQDSEATIKTRVVAIEPSHRDEAIPVIIRLLYGIIISRRGQSSNGQGQVARRQAVLNSLNGCTENELSVLVDLMLRPFGDTLEDVRTVSGRQQMGFLSLLADVIRHLGPRLGKQWTRIITTTIHLVGNAQEQLIACDIVTKEENESAEDIGIENGLAPLRNIRSFGLKRIVQFLNSTIEFDIKPYLPIIFKSIISPRLDKLEVENSQAPSGTLDLIAALASEPATLKELIKLDERTLSKTFACMTAVKVKPAVVLRVFDIIESLLVDDDSEYEISIRKEVLIPHIKVLIDNMIDFVAILKSFQSNDITHRLLHILSRLSVLVQDGQQAQQLATLLAPILCDRRTPERAKTHILAALQRLYTISTDFPDPSSKFFYQAYNLVSSLFQSLYLSTSRRALIITLETFALTDKTLEESINIVRDMNAYSTRKLEEPDFDKRLSAYESIVNISVDKLSFSPRAWMPILRSALFFLNEPEELSIRSNASAVLQKYICITGDAFEGCFVEMLRNVVLPGLKRAIKSKQELVRNEALLVIAQGVKICTGIEELNEMRPLLAEGDDEASFFANITHIQVHRRARALVRLRSSLSEPSTSIRESNITSIFLPLLEHVIAGATDVSDHHFINESIQTVGELAKLLRWSKWYGLIGRYMKLGTGSGKMSQQKYYVRTVTSVIDGFHFDLDGALYVEKKGEEMIAEEEDRISNHEEGDEFGLKQAVVGASPDKMIAIIQTRLLPLLSKFVYEKGDAESTIRIPLAFGIVKIAHFLPRNLSDTEVLKVITNVSQILRSRDQDTRDTTRDTICKIAIYLGPDWLVRIIKELETALPRGPQKHVLAVTTHAILVQATTQAADKFINLDDAVDLAARIVAEVVWGESGKDVATEGFKTKMREVRGATSKGFDTFQLLAQLVTPSKIGAVLGPVREVMSASQAVKAMQQIDEALRRISLGLNSNSILRPQDILSLCYSLISGNSLYLRAKKKTNRPAATPDAFKVVMKRENGKGQEDFYAANAHKLVMFGLDLFVTAFRRNKFNFEDVDILARLGPMVNAIGNTLYSSASDVLMLSLKATAAITRCPIPQVKPALHIFVNNIFQIIKHAGGTAESEVAQTALKTLAVILRDCKTSEVSENQLRYLIEVINPDLEEPERQSSVFAILRVIVTRQFVVPEIYDLMERVSSIMITSQSTHVQELCRGSVMAFLLDYPQGKNRLKSQMTFFAQNLQYTYESGRLSILEVLSVMFDKFSDALVEEYAGLFFVALVTVRANDDSEKCRVAAGELLKLLWKRLNRHNRRKFSEVIKSWIRKREENGILAGAAMDVSGLLVETGEDGLDDLTHVIVPVLQESAKKVQKAEEQEQSIELDLTLPHQTLSVATKLILSSPSTSSSLPWADIVSHLLFPHEHVRYDAAKLISSLFVKDTEVNGACDMLGEELCIDIAKKCCLVLQNSRRDDGEWANSGKLADEIVKVLYNLTKHRTFLEVSASAYEVAETDEDGDNEGQNNALARKPLAWIMSRMSFIARHLLINRPAPNSPQSSQPWSLPILSILRFFAGLTERFCQEQATEFLIHTLSPIYRILDEGGDLKQLEDKQVDDLREMATQIREFIQKKVGTLAFSRTWEKLRRATQAKRQERREERVKMAITNPEKHAGRRERKSERAKESKKRKIQAFNEGHKMKKRM